MHGVKVAAGALAWTDAARPLPTDQTLTASANPFPEAGQAVAP